MHPNLLNTYLKSLYTIWKWDTAVNWNVSWDRRLNILRLQLKTIPDCFEGLHSAIKYQQCFFFSDDIEPTVRVNQWAQASPGISVRGILSVRPPLRQHGLPSSHNTPSVCSPVVPVKQVLPSPSLRLSLEHMCLCPSVPRVPPPPFSLGMLSLPVAKAQGGSSLSTSVKIRFSFASPLLFLRTLCIRTVGVQLSRAALLLPPPPLQSPP